MKTTFSKLFLLFAIVLLSSSGCKIESDLFTIRCGPFDGQLLEWFPYEQGDVLEFTGTDTTAMFRDLVVFDERTFADTTYESLFENDVCSPSVEFLVGEDGDDRTVLNFTILDLSETGTEEQVAAISLNISDVNAGNAYFQQLVFDEDGGVTSGANTDLTMIDSLVVSGVLYEDVLRLDLINAPDFTAQFRNDVRSIWLVRGAGIIRFRDEALGAFELEP